MLGKQTCVSLVLPVALLAGCFNPDYGEGGFLCTGDGDCPDGLKDVIISYNTKDK